MARRRRAKAKRGGRRTWRYGSYGETAHVSRLYVGRCIPIGQDACARIVSPRDARKVAERIARSVGGAATVFPARGIWKEARRPGTREPTMVVETITSGASGCQRLTARMHARAGAVARTLKQSAVLVTVQCAGRALDASLIDRRGRVFTPLLRLPARR